MTVTPLICQHSKTREWMQHKEWLSPYLSLEVNTLDGDEGLESKPKAEGRIVDSIGGYLAQTRSLGDVELPLPHKFAAIRSSLSTDSRLGGKHSEPDKRDELHITINNECIIDLQVNEAESVVQVLKGVDEARVPNHYIGVISLQDVCAQGRCPPLLDQVVECVCWPTVVHPLRIRILFASDSLLELRIDTTRSIDLSTDGKHM